MNIKNTPILKGLIWYIIILVVLSGTISAQSVSFNSSELIGLSLGDQPTSLQFGPDGRLYVAERFGIIKVLTVVRNGANNYEVTATETIDLIQTILNHDDDGTPKPSLTTRQVTGIFVAGTASNPIIYVTSSDPRHGGGVLGLGNNKNLDTNSGVISKISWNGASWEKLDLVRGLPRSEEYHSINGLFLDESTNTLYMTQGGNTNMGAPSNNFIFLPEYAYSTAILTIDLDAIGNSTYDLPTLDDEDRTNIGSAGFEDEYDPFGGNNGKNQAMLELSGPVQIYSTGWRNNYDLIMSEAGKLYSVDNGPNAGWGDLPSGCSNATTEPGVTYCDVLHYVTGPGYYAGHPNPTRANRSNTFNASNPQTPIPLGMENADECNYIIAGNQTGALATICSSTNGLCEYTASNFSNAMKGDLLTVSFNGKLNRFQLNGSGDAVTNQSELASNFGSTPLDVVAQGDGNVFPGTIWVAVYEDSTVVIFEPNDFVTCTGDSSSYVLDFDNDGFSNGDELDNNTDYCSPASKPADFDGDFLSNLNDPDDDNDGIPDSTDAFALDPDNGTTTTFPVTYSFENTNVGGIGGWGFTGIMTNGTSDYMDLYNEELLTVGGAAVKFTVDAASEGDAYQTVNTQENGFQFGVNVGGYFGSYIAHTKVMAPFAGITPQNFQSMGMFIGTGDQDNYLKIVTSANNGVGGIQIFKEVGAATTGTMYPVNILGSNYVDLFLTIDPVTNMVQPSYSINGGVETLLGSPVAIPASWISNVMALGFISTSTGPAAPFAATWDFISLTPAPSTGNWFNVNSTNNPEARHECAFVHAGDHFCLLGSRGIKSVGKFNPSDSTWTTGANPPVEMHHFQAVEYKGLIYVVGAFTGSYPNETPLSNIYIYDPSGNSWEVGPEIPASRRRGSGGTVVYNDKIYWVGGIINGHTSGWVNWLDEFDPATNTWTQLASAPRNRDHFHAVVANDQLYTIGGRNTNLNGNVFSETVAEVDIYDLQAGTWSTLPSPGGDLPTERAGAAVALLGDEILVIGGESGQSIAHNETEALDINDHSWRSLSTLITGRHGTQAIVSNEGLYIAGGAGNQGSTPLLSSQEAFYFNEKTDPVSTPIVKGAASAVSTKNFGQLYTGNSLTKQLAVNVSGGNQGILITDISRTGSNDFSFTTPYELPMLVSPGEFVNIQVTFEPTSAGNKAANLNIQHTGSNGSLSVALSGDGLENTPCEGDSTNYEEQGGILIMEVESAPASGDWVKHTTLSNYTGSGYYTWEGNGQFSATPTQGILTYEFNISTTGRYRFQIRSYQPGPQNTEENDVWAYFPDAQAIKIKNAVESNITGWFKVYQNTAESWTFNSFTTDFDPNNIFVEFPTAGTYTLKLAGRSENFSIDRVTLYDANANQWQATGALNPESSTGSGSGGDCNPELTVWYDDVDGDNYGSTTDSIFAETQPSGYASNKTDCNDNNNTVYPGAAEIEDGLDNNCNGLIDEGFGGGGGSSNNQVLFLVGNTSLNNGDQAIKDRLELLGFVVTIVDDADSETSDADGKGLIIISSTVSSGSVNTKYTNVAVPLINWEPALVDDLNIASGASSTGSVSQLNITNSAHPLAGGLSNGTTTVFSSAQTASYGSPVGSAITIGNINGNSGQVAIFGYETGTAMDGMNAPARRVGFFLHDVSAASLTANGLALLDAAILWASDYSSNEQPAVTITAPANNASYIAPATVSIAATASDPDGDIAKVEFFNGATKLGQDLTSPYTFNWTNIGEGNYTIIAVATDNDGGTATDSIVIGVNDTINFAPTVSITSPGNGALFYEPATITVNATAADPDGSIASVSFYEGANFLGTDATAPFSFTWVNVSLGNYALTAVATDNEGKMTTSTAVNVIVDSLSVSADALLVVGNLTLNAGDQAIKGRLEALGFGVTLVQAAASSSSDAGNKDIVVISSTVNSNDVNTKFTNVSVPVLNCESALFDDLKMTGSGSSSNGSSPNESQIEIINNAHPLAAGLPIGILTVFNSPDDMAYGSPSGAAISIATLVNASTLNTIFGYESGALMVGMNAPARRTGFFLKDDGTSLLTADGISLLDAAILWTTDINTPPTINITTPANNATFVAPANITIEADAADSDGNILSVSFYEGANLLGTDNTDNYSFSWTNVPVGIYTLTAVALDNDSATATSSEITVVVESANTPPTFTTSGDITVDQNFGGIETVTVTPDAVPDADSAQVVTYSLSPASVTFANVSINPATGEVTITAVADSSGIQLFTITADDGESSNNTATQTFVLSVVPANTPPTFTISSFLTADEDFVGTLSVNVTPDPVSIFETDQVVTYSLDPPSVPFANVSINSLTGQISISAIADANGSQLFTVIADDGQAEDSVATQPFTLTVNPVNDPPTFITSGNVNLIEDFAGTIGVTAIPDAVPADEAGQTVTYSLDPASVGFANVSINPVTGEVSISAVPNGFGTQLFTVTANDGQAEDNIATAAFTLNIAQDLTPPKPVYINAGGPAYVTVEGDSFMADVYYSSPSTALTVGSLAGAIDSTNDDALFITERYSDSLSYNIPLEENGWYTVKLFFAETYIGQPGGGFGKGVGDRMFDIHLEGSLAIDSFDIFAEAGTATALCKVFDSVEVVDGFMDIDMFAITNNAKINAISVAPVTIDSSNTAPTFTTSGDITVDEDFVTIESVTVTPNPVPALDADQVVAYSLSPASVSFADVSINPATGEVTITAIANANGTQLFTITADDGQAEDNLATQTFTLTVNPVNDAPTFSASGNIFKFVNFATTESVTVTPDPVPADETGQTVTYSLLPPSVTFANVSIDSNTGEVTITAVTDSFGSQLFTIMGNDGQGVNNTATQNFTLTVNEEFTVEANPVYINAGGPAYVSLEGDTFMADQFYSTPSTALTVGALAGSINNTNDDPLYVSERYHASLSYDIPLQYNGLYQVKLFFSETYIGQPGGGLNKGVGDRVFDIYLEGALALDSFDIFLEAGTATAIIKEFDSVEVNDMSLDLDMIASANNAKINAICITPLNLVVDNSNNPPTVSITNPLDNDEFLEGQSLNFTANASDDVGVTKVEFYEGGNLLGEDLTAPFEFLWSNLQIGNYALTAKAYDDSTSTTSDIVNISVIDTPSTNTPPTFTVSGNVTVSKNFPTIESLTVTPDPVPANELGQIVTYSLNPPSVTFANVSINSSTGKVTILAVADSIGSQLFTITADDGQAEDSIATQTFTLTVNDVAPPTPSSAIYINAGGPAFVTLAGDSFKADANFLFPSNTFVKAIPIANTDDDVLYQTERYDDSLRYHIPLDNGQYNVKLFFAEIYIGQPGGGSALGVGDRLFDINIENTLVLDSFDIYSEAGTATAIIKEFDSISVVDGFMDIRLNGIARQGKLSALCIVPVGVANDSTDNPPVVAITNPANNDEFLEGTDLNITANAFDDNGVTKVEFYEGVNLLGEDLTAPYSFLWTNLQIGNYALTAKAYDNSSSTTSAVVNISVVDTPAGPVEPSVTIISPTEGQNIIGDEVTLFWTASNLGIDDHIHVIVDGVLPHTTVFDSVGSLLISDLAAGEHTILMQVANSIHQVYPNPEATDSVTFTTDPVSTTPQEALFVVGNTTLNSGDQAVKGRLELLGLNVTLVSGPASATNDANGKDIVIISSTVNSGDVNTKFTNVAVPVVNWEQALHDDLKTVGTSSANRGTATGKTQTAIINAAHEMAAGLSGNVTVYTAAEGMTWGQPNANAIKVATIVGNANQVTIYGYESGAAMFGLNAPARRVGFMLHDVGASLWTANGTALFDAAIIWALGAEITPPNTPPTVSITNPTEGQNFFSPANITINAIANDVDGNVVKVAFYQGATKVSEDFIAPYSFSWTNVPNGNYSLTAKAFDDSGDSTTSTAVNITVTDSVVSNTPPAVAITSPTNGASFSEPANIAIAAAASDVDGTVSKVAFYQGTTKLGEDLTAPYTLNWNSVVAGSYTLTARAFDNSGDSTTSAPINITVISSSGQIALLVVGNTSLNNGDQAVKNRLELLGLTVQVKSGPQSATADATGKALIVISSTVTSGNVNTKFTNVNVPVINWEQALYDDLKMTDVPGSSHGNEYNQTQIGIQIANSGHPMSAALSGVVTVYTTGEVLSWGTPNANAIKIATIPTNTNKAVIFGYEAGASMFGINAPARRVGLFLENSGAAFITANGLALFDAAVIWALGTGTPNSLPTVGLTSPTNGAIYTAPATVAIAANASDSDGSITKVEFYQGAIKIGEDLTAPYTFSLTSVPAGSYSITAKAFDNLNASATSSAINITVNPGANLLPTVSVTTPVNGAIFTAPATVAIAATASDADGSISKVEFYQGAVKLGEDLTAPYTLSWTSVAAGTYSITAKAFDNLNASKTSTAVNITVNPAANTLPTVSITSPVNAATFSAPATVAIAATASDPDGSISKVEFYQGAVKLGEDLTAPYSLTWNSVPAGSYSLTAKAFDNLNASATSSVINITVSSGNTPPTVSITSPANNALFNAPANITITANAADANGSVAKVEFYQGATKLGEDLTAPYSLTWNSVGTGSYSLTAKATDNLGATTTSTAVSITVTTPGSGASVHITSPINGSTFGSGTGIIISASVSGFGTQPPYLDLTNSSTGWKQFRLGYDPSSVWVNPKNVTATGNNTLQITLRDFSGNAPWSLLQIRPQGNSSTPHIDLLPYVNAVGGIGNSWKTISIPLSAFTAGIDFTQLTMVMVYGAGAGAFHIGIQEIKFTGGSTPFVWFGGSKTNNAHDGNGSAGGYTATVVSSGNTVSKVQFYQGANLLGQDLTSPYSIVWAGASAGNYTLTAVAIDNTNTSYTSNPVNITVSSGLKQSGPETYEEDNKLLENLAVYPNPSTGRVIVEFENGEAENIDLLIFNHMGQQLQANNWTEFKGHFKEQIDLNDYATGMYFIQLKVGDININKKLLIKR